MANKLTRLGGPGKFGAWVRYGGKPITQQQLDFAVKNYSVAILQPWELDAGTLPEEACTSNGGAGVQMPVFHPLL